jgi:isopenicillin N synthase-like dioxygenase
MLPIINVKPYLNLTSADADQRQRVASAIHVACRDVGFFYLDVSDLLSQAEMDEVLQVGREFFARPQEEKESIGLAHSDGVRGE